MKAISLFSGGKDSFFSAMTAMEQGFEIQFAITIDPEEYSMMFHYPNTAVADLSASLLDLEVRHIKEEEFQNALADAKNAGIEAVVSGAIASEYQKTRIERLCTELGMVSYTPIWRKDQSLLLYEMLNSGVKAKIVSVSAEGMTEEDLGRPIDREFITRMKELDSRIGINIAGEGGEYESYVYGLVGSGEIIFDKTSKIWRGSGGYLIIESAHLDALL